MMHARAARRLAPPPRARRCSPGRPASSRRPAPAGAANGATTPATRGSPSTRRSIRSTSDNVGNLRIAWRRPAVADELRAAAAGPALRQQPSLDAADDRRRAVRLERHRPGRGVRPGHRQDDLGAGGSTATAPRRGPRAASPTGGPAPTRVCWPCAASTWWRSSRRPARSSAASAATDASTCCPAIGPQATGFAWTSAPQVCNDVVIIGSVDDRLAATQGRWPPGQRAGDRRPDREACAGRSIRFRGQARSATRPGRTTRGRTAARPTSGR